MIRRTLLSRFLGPALAVMAALGGIAWAQDSDEPPVDAAYFRTTIQPILEANCLRCHGAGERLRGGLRLTSRAALARGGDSGPAVDETNFDQSLLLLMVRWEDEQFQMPPGGRLPEDELRAFERWVQAGAPYDPELEVEGEDEEEGPSLSRHDDGLVGWAYRELSVSSMLSEADRPIDEYVNARLAAEGLRPNPVADRVTLIRRATFDLTGLPPTPEEVQAFVADDSPDAWESLIDRLLASPRYGEKWGRFWLDLVRYAETNGFERDSDKPFIWRYRDWVIDSLNADKPFDRFTLEQLCGDELDDASPETRIATGYYRLPQWDDEPPQGPLQARYDVLDDVARTTSEVFLGTTIGCARCHDHPADPISQEDYYSFVGFFDGLTDITVDGYVTTEMTAEELAEWSRQEGVRAARERELAREIDRRVTEARERLVERDGGRIAADLLGGEADIFLPAAVDDEGRTVELFAQIGFPELPVERGRFSLGPHDDLDETEPFSVHLRTRLDAGTNRLARFRLHSDDSASVFVGVSASGVRVPFDPASGISQTVVLGADEVQLELTSKHGAGSSSLRLDWQPLGQVPWYFTESEYSKEWRVPGFDMSGWRVGGPSFGEAHPHAKGDTPWSSETIWLRHVFEWDAPSEAFGLVLFHDDDLEVWINGVLALELSGYITEYAIHEVSEEARAALVPGRNWIAVHCRQDFGGQYVHVAPIDLRNRMASTPRDLAHGWRPLTRLDGRYGSPAAAEAVRPRLAEVFDEAEVAEFEAAVAALRQVQTDRPQKKRAATAQERAEIGDLHVHVRGNPNVPGAKVEPRFPTEMTSAEPAWPTLPEGVQSSGRRRALAEWIVESSLFARVLANRLWQGHFGRGLVATSSDFGELGDRPTHPELLDWLAREARERAWSLKDLHRLVMTSETYRRSSDANADALTQDPTNTTFWRFDRRRLQAEEVRDAMLATAGVLNEEQGGPPFFARVSEEELATSSTPHSVWGTSPKEETNRRSIYAKVKRSLRPATLANFDAADTDASCPVRFETVQPGQALGLMNGLFAREMATELAGRVLTEAGDAGLRGAIARAVELGLGRTASAAEVDRLEALHAELLADFELEPTAALADVCLVVFNLNEFLYLD